MCNRDRTEYKWRRKQYSNRLQREWNDYIVQSMNGEEKRTQAGCMRGRKEVKNSTKRGRKEDEKRNISGLKEEEKRTKRGPKHGA